MDNEKVGSLWKKVSKKGKKFLAGVITVDGKDVRVVGFVNTDKKNDKAPDIQLYKSKPFHKEDSKTEMVRDIFEDF